MKRDKKALTLKTLNKSNIWEIQENDIFRLWAVAEKDIDTKDNIRRYADIVKSAFLMEEIKGDDEKEKKRFEKLGYKIGTIQIDETTKLKWAIKKRPILRVTDLTYDNIHHISASKLIEVLDRNFGSGWDALSQSIQDIIEAGFDITTTTLPTARMHKKGGMFEKKISDGYEALEIPKGTWIEAIFAKKKEEKELLAHKNDDDTESKISHLQDSDADTNSLVDENTDASYSDEDDYDDDKLTEESYRTTFDTTPEDLNLEAEDVSDDESDY